MQNIPNGGRPLRVIRFNKPLNITKFDLQTFDSREYIELEVPTIDGITDEYDEILIKLEDFYKKISESTNEMLINEDYLSELIGNVGLFYDDRKHPDLPSINLYGDDVKYMNSVKKVGLWQVPRQLALYLIKLSTLDIKSFLDIGTCSGITITVIAIYLSRFALTTVQTIDANNYVNSKLFLKWNKLSIPITYTLIKDGSNYLYAIKQKQWDIVFIDGNHSYDYVKNDYLHAKQISKILTFHDINDVFCTDVVKLWNEIKLEKDFKNYYEFTYHSHNQKLMGIGLLML